MKRRLALGAATATTVGAVATLVAGFTFGMFSASAAGGHNSFSAGTVTLANGAVANCPVSNLLPGTAPGACTFTAAYSGSVPAYLAVNVLIETQAGSGGTRLYNPADSASDLQVAVTSSSPSVTYTVPAGSGTANGTVSVKFSSANNVGTTIDVVQLSGNNTSTPIAGSAVSTGTGTTITGGPPSPGTASDGELFFAGLSGSTTMSTPAGYTALDVPASTVHGTWFSSSASSTAVTTSLGASNTWGSIEVEISHG